MKFYGFQKMTVLDYPEKVACVVFTGGCNFRCPFCHNARLVTDIENKTYDEQEILEYLQSRIGLIDGICITGGEPLLQVGLDSFLEKVKKIGVSVKLDTNGSFPARLKSLVSKKLVDYVAMDVKNCKEKYSITTGCKSLDLQNIEESVEFLLSNTVDYEFRTTVVENFHEVEDFEKIGTWIQGTKKYFLQNFVDSGNLICKDLSSVKPEKLKEIKEKVSEFVENVGIRGV